MLDLEQSVYNQEAESSVIGSILLEGDLIKECYLQPEHFFNIKNQIIMRTFREIEYKNEPIDFVSVVERLNDKVHKIGGVDYLSQLANSIPSLANFSFYQRLVMDYSKMRSGVSVANKLRDSLAGSKDITAINTSIYELMKIDEEGLEEEFNMQETLSELYEEMDKEVEGISGIPSGYPDLDRMTNGWQEQDLIIIGARPSMGKTAFALNLAENASKKHVVAIFSLEMGKKQLFKRMISSIGRIEALKMRNPRRMFNNDDWAKRAHAFGQLEQSNLYVYDKPGVTVQDIYTKSRKLRNQNKDKKVLIMIDYLQLIVGSAKHNGNRTAEISEISRFLKLMARELNVTVMALSQLSRGVESRQDKRPMMSDLRESGQIEQDADVIGFLYRDDYYDKESEQQNIIEVILAKQRNNPIGVVELAFLKEYNKFLSLDRRQS